MSQAHMPKDPLTTILDYPYGQPCHVSTRHYYRRQSDPDAALWVTQLVVAAVWVMDDQVVSVGIPVSTAAQAFILICKLQEPERRQLRVRTCLIVKRLRQQHSQ